MDHRTFTKTALGIGLLAGVLGAAIPTEAPARGGFGGVAFHGGFRGAAPVFRAAPVHAAPVRAAPIRVAPIRTGHVISRFAHRRTFGTTAFPMRHFGFGHHHHRGANVYYGGYADPGIGYPITAYDDPSPYALGPACRTQDYVVPSEDGEDRTVRVLRC